MRRFHILLKKTNRIEELVTDTAAITLHAVQEAEYCMRCYRLIECAKLVLECDHNITFIGQYVGHKNAIQVASCRRLQSLSEEASWNNMLPICGPRLAAVFPRSFRTLTLWRSSFLSHNTFTHCITLHYITGLALLRFSRKSTLFIT